MLKRLKIILCLICINAHANLASQSAAEQHALNAFYKQVGLEDYVNTTVQNLDKKYVPEFIHDEGALAAILLQISIKHQISWKWRF